MEIFVPIYQQVKFSHSTTIVENFLIKKETIRTFLVPARKVRKEADIGKALCAELPLVKSALPYVPIPAASP